MSDKGCNNCKHYKMGERMMWEDDKPRSCLLGNNTEMNLWWQENGMKTSDEVMTDMPCFEKTETAILFDSMSEKLNQIKEILKTNQNNG